MMCFSLASDNVIVKIQKQNKMEADGGVDISKLSDVFSLTWSVDTKHDVFQRWSQGRTSLQEINAFI